MTYPTISQGSYRQHKDAVRALQRLLHLQEDGIFGPLTTEALKQWQTDHNLKADGICGPKTWAALLAENVPSVAVSQQQDSLLAGIDLSAVRPTTRRSITEIIVHCTATPEGKPFTVQDIRRWHVTPVSKGGRGWSDIGYHYVITLDGKIHAGRDVNISGAHCTGHNSHSVGVVYVGGMDAQNKNPKDTRTAEQKRAMLALLQRLLTLYPGAKVKGHCEYANKACPSFEPSTLRTELRKMGCRV